ncbi:hypothetical protein OG568_52170 (plasmid) [Streptomyces sp. NBC_01450]|uniref:hypothetical protein n=1 Tax=Streptomyces sp. NBC_01450 TaxID=2903871 RepID=UPI002E36E3E5|nr:hypothetical protein [Streptomyces sp. NBC_01450]
MPPQRFTEVTRQRLPDFLEVEKVWWWGALDEVRFLQRLLRPIHPHPHPPATAPGRTQPAQEGHGSALQRPHPPRPPLRVPTPAGQRFRPGGPRQQSPRQMLCKYTAPPGQLLLRHPVEQHLAVRTPTMPALHRVRPPPRCREIGDLQPVSGRHPVQ